MIYYLIGVLALIFSWKDYIQSTHTLIERVFYGLAIVFCWPIVLFIHLLLSDG